MSWKIRLFQTFHAPYVENSVNEGKWYRVPLSDVQSGGRTPAHVLFRKGKENKLMVFLTGGGVFWNGYMAARYDSPYGRPDKTVGFYSVDSFLFSDVLRHFGYLSKGKKNPFHDWSTVMISYDTGDFHCGTKDYSYTAVDGTQKVLHCHGLTNVKAALEAVMEFLPHHPQSVMVTGCSAGGFGTALISDEIFQRFPDAEEYISYNDSGFMLHRDWRGVARDVWGAPETIYHRLVSDNISLDSMVALKKKYKEKVKILFSCSVRDSALTQFWSFEKWGDQSFRRADGDDFQRDLKEMVRELSEKIPDVSIFLFDLPDQASGDAKLTAHCIAASSAIYKVKADGVPCMQWLVAAVAGNSRQLGLDLLEKQY